VSAQSATNQETSLQVVQPTPLPSPARGPRLGLPTRDELANLRAYGEIVIASGLAPKHIATPEAAIVVMRYGAQLGVDEFTALQHMYVINGKPAADASLLHAVTLRDHGGDSIEIVTSTAAECTLRCRRRDSRLVTDVSYTLKEAEEAGLPSKNGVWKVYPKDMLFARCISRAGRQVFRDSTLGMYTPEELGASIIEVNGEVVDVAGGEVPRDDRPRSTNRLANLHRIGETRGLDHDALHRIAVLKLGMGLGDRKLTDTMLRDFEQIIEVCSEEDLILWQLDWMAEIAAAERIGADSLAELGKRIKLAGITRESHLDIAQAFGAAQKRAAAQPTEGEYRELDGSQAQQSAAK
jgi:hypothetical protein